MPSSDREESLIRPALRATMGDWVYYVTYLTMRDIADLVSIAEEINESKTLNDLIQRSLAPRPAIVQYLLTQEQRFFNALVIGVYGGQPNWYSLEIEDSNFLEKDRLPADASHAVGFLELGRETAFFAIDGQHRVVGIREALKQRADLGSEEVAAIFIGHGLDRAGRQRTRRLFATLNRYAKPVSKRDIIALDEDDVIAIVTRQLLEARRSLEGRVSLLKGKAIPKSDITSITSIVALYDSLDVLLKDRRGWARFKARRPDDAIIGDYFARAMAFWSAMEEHFDLPSTLSRDSPDHRLRSDQGGHLLFRPIGLTLYAKTVRSLIDAGLNVDEAVRRISRAPAELSEFPWAGLLFDRSNGRMITASANQNVATKLLLLSLLPEESAVVWDRSEVEAEWAGLINREPGDVSIPRFVTGRA